MGDGDEGIGPRPVFFFVLRMSSGRRVPVSAACSLPALSVPRASCHPLPVLLVVCRGVGRGGSAVPSCCAVGLVARRSLPRVGRRGGGLLACVPRLGAQCGWRGGSLCRLLLAWVRLDWGVCGLCGVSFSRLIASGEACILILVPWMLFSPFFVSWHVLVRRAALLVLSPTSLSSIYPHELVPPGHGLERFFLSIFISSHPSAACLLLESLFATRLLSYLYRPVPRPALLDTDGRGGSWLRYG